jgi:hypothetical protein
MVIQSTFFITLFASVSVAFGSSFYSIVFSMVASCTKSPEEKSGCKNYGSCLTLFLADDTLRSLLHHRYYQAPKHYFVNGYCICTLLNFYHYQRCLKYDFLAWLFCLGHSRGFARDRLLFVWCAFLRSKN